MKLILIASILLGSLVLAQGMGPKVYRVSLQLSVIDDEGLPVEGAEAVAGFEIPQPPSGGPYTKGHRGVTDRNGQFAVSADTTGVVFYGAKKPGYYDSSGQRFDVSFDERGQPSNLTGNKLIVVLKRIKDPVPMYVKRVSTGVPLVGVPVEYDLEQGDWLPPHGAGLVADLLLTVTIDQRAQFDFDYDLQIAFSNPHDGLIVLDGTPLQEGSQLRSPHVAPLDGYQSNWSIHRRRTASTPEISNLDPNRIYILRLRTVVNAMDEIVSAHYGKIYGEFLHMTHYFNPEPNDRSLEFDLENNLARGQPGTEYTNLP